MTLLRATGLTPPPASLNIHARMHILPCVPPPGATAAAAAASAAAAAHAAAALFDARNHVPHRYMYVSALHPPARAPDFGGGSEHAKFSLAELWDRRAEYALYVVLLARADTVPGGLACLGCTAIPLVAVRLLLF